MAEVLLFHHALGLTDGVRAFADELRRAGHTVHTPDLFEGRTFDSIEAGVGHAREVGFGDALLESAVEAGRAAGCVVIEGEALPGDRDLKNLYERAGITARLIIVSKPL